MQNLPHSHIFGEIEGIEPELKVIINIFQKSPDYAYINRSLGHPGPEEERVEDLLGDDVDQIIV